MFAVNPLPSPTNASRYMPLELILPAVSILQMKVEVIELFITTSTNTFPLLVSGLTRHYLPIL